MAHIHQQEYSRNQARIAIIGAGIAGLNAALTLQDAGLVSVIYEASERIGGRMHSDAISWGDGMVSDWCGEFIDSDHKTLLGLIKRFGLQTVNLGQEVPAHAQNMLYFFNHYASYSDLAEGFQSIYPILAQQVQEAGFPTIWKRFTEEGYRLDHLSVYDWIEQYVEGGHNTLIGHMLDGACTGLFGLDTHTQSSLNLVYMFGPRISEDTEGFDETEGTEDDDSVGSGPMQGSYKIDGGNQQLPLAIASSLPQGSIHLNHQLIAIKRNNDDTITLSLATPGGALEVTYDHVILTLPFSTLRHVDYRQARFDDLKQTAITRLGYGTISKLFLQFDTRYWYQQGHPWPGINNGFFITDLPIQVLWDASLGQGGSKGLLVDYTSGPRGADYNPPTPYTTSSESPAIQSYARRCLEQLEQVFPGISAHYTGKSALSYPTGDPYLQGSYSCWLVGQYTLFAGYERVRQGSIHFAGEHCSLTYQGYMEGGACEGARAAREVLDDYGLKQA